MNYALKRAWRSRGFGIHSPFAFRFTTAVLRERCEYYSYAVLRQLAADKRHYGRLTLIVRLICEFRPDFIVLTAHDASIVEAVRLADSRVAIHRHLPPAEADKDSSPLFILDGMDETTLTDFIRSHGSKTATAVIFNLNRDDYRSLTKILDDVRTCGMTFYNLRDSVVVLRPDLPRQDFEINF